MIKASNKIEREFENLRKELLDLTLRNQLLNFKPRAKTLVIENQTPSNIYQTLVMQNKKMYFAANKKENEENSHFSIWNHSPIDFSKFSGGDTALKTNLTPNELQKRLFYINNQAKTMLQEQGYNILYLAVGFLEWSDNSKPKQKNLAPLILIPVTMERKKVGKSFELSWTGEDIQTNISLKAKLKENGITLPDFEAKKYGEVIDFYIKKVREATRKMPNWSVNPNVALGFFSFTKFVMYNDLNPESWDSNVDLTQKELIQAIFNPSKNSQEAFDEEEIDTRLSYENMYQVLDADSSQIAAIEDVKAGRNLVVEGPPGTGKSQTIVNLIAELLAEGKSVLFVSEKMAALEVVKNRLQQVGLGKFVLELHSHKTRRKKLLKELEKATSVRSEEPFNVDQTIRKLETLRRQLDDYANIIHKPVYAINLSPFQLYGMKESAADYFSNEDKIIPLVRVENPESLTIKDLDDIIFSLENVAELYQTISADNPWSKCAPKSLLPADLREIELLITDSLQALDAFLGESSLIYETYGIKKPETFGEFEKSLKAFDIIQTKNSSLIDSFIIQSSYWRTNYNDSLVLIKDLDTYQSNSLILDKFNDNILNADIDGLINEIRSLDNKRFKFFKSKQHEEIVSRYYKGQVPGTKKVLSDLLEVKKALYLKNQIDSRESLAQKFFGRYWDVNANINDLTSIARWMKEFYLLVDEDIFSKNTIDLLARDLFNINPQTNLNDYIEVGNNFKNKISKLQDKLNPRSKLIFKKDVENVTFDQWRNQLNDWRGQLSSLHLWSQYLNTKEGLKGTVADQFVETIEKYNINKYEIKSLVFGNFADSLLNILFIDNSELATFIGELHENRVHEFEDLDRKILALNRKRIFHNLNQNIPKIYGSTDNPEAQILAGEFTRKSGHLPVRKLLNKAGGIIKQIKPVFMMSPLSIAQYLDPTNEELQFDVVIFDEASQMKPQDALGAFMRGKTAVVMGDTQQLPPTSFFDQMADSESDEEEATSLDMESILHLCKLSFPVKMLKWHYRSRHESLIAVSNTQFYDDELLVYPSPSHDDSELGLKLNYNPDTVYDRGSTAANRLEAKDVVKAVFEHFETYGDSKSIGVGTFSVAQKNAILEELELERKNRPEFESLFDEKRDERFFVKNLETIQGDERDVILISVGYGFDENGKMSLNFGPLNQNGGERRLNVLITRAREKCVVFTNFKSSDMHLSQNPPFGVKSLRNFLSYGENLASNQVNNQNNETELFEDTIYNFLLSKGYKVDKQVGCAGFRMDLALVDEENPGKYFLGITTDGKTYASSKVARDRDRLREQILKDLGWNIYHLWSTDWYRNRELGQKKLLDAVEKAKETYTQVEQNKKEEAEKRKVEIERRAKELKKEREKQAEEERKLQLSNEGIELVDIDGENNNGITPEIILDNDFNSQDDNKDKNTIEPIIEDNENIIVENKLDDNINKFASTTIEPIEEINDNELIIEDNEEDLEPILNVEDIKEDFINEVTQENEMKNDSQNKKIDDKKENIENNFEMESKSDLLDDNEVPTPKKSIKERLFGIQPSKSKKNNLNNSNNKIKSNDDFNINFRNNINESVKKNIKKFHKSNNVSEDNNENFSYFKEDIPKNNNSEDSFNKNEFVKGSSFEGVNDNSMNINDSFSDEEFVGSSSFTKDSDDLFNDFEDKNDSFVEEEFIEDSDFAEVNDNFNKSNYDDINESFAEGKVSYASSENNIHEESSFKNKNFNHQDIFENKQEFESSINEDDFDIQKDNLEFFNNRKNIKPIEVNVKVKSREEKDKSKRILSSILDDIKKGESKINVTGNKVYDNDLNEKYIPKVENNEYFISNSFSNENANFKKPENKPEYKKLTKSVNESDNRENKSKEDDLKEKIVNEEVKSKNTNQTHEMDNEELMRELKRELESDEGSIVTIYAEKRRNKNKKQDIGENNQEQPSKKEDDLRVVDYEMASDFGLSSADELYSKSSEEIAKSINQIVETESPVHIKEVIKRIKESCGISRATSKLKKAISEGIDSAEEEGNIIKVDDFLFGLSEEDINIRKRVKPNIDLISDDEIESNIKMVLMSNEKIKPSKLSKEVAYNFGFKSTSKKTASRINNILDNMIVEGKVIMKSDCVEFNS